VSKAENRTIRKYQLGVVARMAGWGPSGDRAVASRLPQEPGFAAIYLSRAPRQPGPWGCCCFSSLSLCFVWRWLLHCGLPLVLAWRLFASLPARGVRACLVSGPEHPLDIPFHGASAAKWRGLPAWPSRALDMFWGCSAPWVSIV